VAVPFASPLRRSSPLAIARFLYFFYLATGGGGSGLPPLLRVSNSSSRASFFPVLACCNHDRTLSPRVSSFWPLPSVPCRFFLYAGVGPLSLALPGAARGFFFLVFWSLVFCLAARRPSANVFPIPASGVFVCLICRSRPFFAFVCFGFFFFFFFFARLFIYGLWPFFVLSLGFFQFLFQLARFFFGDFRFGFSVCSSPPNRAV